MRWTCIIEFRRREDETYSHRVIGLDMVFSTVVCAAIDGYLSSIANPLCGKASRGHVRIKSGDADVDSSGVKVDVVIALIEIIRQTITAEAKTQTPRQDQSSAA